MTRAASALAAPGTASSGPCVTRWRRALAVVWLMGGSSQAARPGRADGRDQQECIQRASMKGGAVEWTGGRGCLCPRDHPGLARTRRPHRQPRPTPREPAQRHSGRHAACGHPPLRCPAVGSPAVPAVDRTPQGAWEGARPSWTAITGAVPAPDEGPPHAPAEPSTRHVPATRPRMVCPPRCPDVQPAPSGAPSSEHNRFQGWS